MNQMEFSAPLGGQREAQSGCGAARPARPSSVRLRLRPAQTRELLGWFLFSHQSRERRSGDRERLSYPQVSAAAPCWFLLAQQTQTANPIQRGIYRRVLEGWGWLYRIISAGKDPQDHQVQP